MNTRDIKLWLLISLGWWLLAGILIYFAPKPHGDMLLYLNEAHTMYHNGIYLATYRGSELFLEKTPFLYWPLLLIWSIFGENLLEVYIYTFIIGWINLFLVWWLAKQLRPDNFRIAWWSILIIVCNLMWPSFYRDLRFEGLLTLFGLLFLNISLKTLSSRKIVNWVWAGIFFGLCILAKGPVAFVFYIPWICFLPYLSPAPLENFNVWQWYLKITISMILGLLIAVAWVVYIYHNYGSSAVHYLLFTQIDKRISLDHITLTQCLNMLKVLLPWTGAFLLLFNQKIRQHFMKKHNLILLIILGMQLMFFDLLIRMHSPHYLIPMMPTTVILLASLIELIPLSRQQLSLSTAKIASWFISCARRSRCSE